MEIFQDSADKENLDPASMLLHGAGKGKGKGGNGGLGGGNGGGGKSSSNNKGAATSTTTGSATSTKKRKLSAAAAASKSEAEGGACGLGGKAQQGQSSTQPPQRKRPLLRSCSTPPAASSFSSSALPANINTKPHQRANPFLALAAAAMEEQDDVEGNDENADPQRGQQQQQQQAAEARRPETHNSKLFGLLGNRSLPAAANSRSGSNANNNGGGLLMARLGSLAGICLPTASPNGKPQRMEEAEWNVDEEEDDEVSPFNEGYGTRAALPRDLSLKSGLCFEAARPFDWCRAVPAHVEAEGMLRHLKEAAGVAEPAIADTNEEDIAAGLRTREEALAAWVAASYYYSHPADRLPAPQHLALQQVRKQTAGSFAARDPAPVAAGAWQPQGGEGGEMAQQGLTGVLYRRLREWEEAFRHLYGLYRHDASMTFYMVAPDFTVAWTREEKRDGKGEEEDSSVGKLAAEVDALLSQGEEEEEAEAAKGSGGVVPGTMEDEDEDEEGPVKLKAVISTSKRWLRERLRAAGVTFYLPLAPDAAVRDQEDGPAPDVRAELEALRRHDLGVGGHATVELQVAGARRRRVGNGGEIPGHRSHLVVSGALAVHGLFTFLSDLGNALAPNAVGDVPRLLAARPFAHGVMDRLQVAVNTPVQRTLGGLGGDGGMETVYQLKLRGPVMPAQLRRLAGVVHYFNVGEGNAEMGQQGQQKLRGAMAMGDWSLTMEVAPGTEAFNKNGGGSEEGEGKGQEGAMSMKEVRFHAAKGRFVTIRMTAPSPSSSARVR